MPKAYDIMDSQKRKGLIPLEVNDSQFKILMKRGDTVEIS
jgi:hypothetical protein